MESDKQLMESVFTRHKKKSPHFCPFSTKEILTKSAFRGATRGDAPEENGKIVNFL